ncbi:hypothetical protein EVG20_g114 [Dentipellis fragilis]|uniref:Uncharacterized protein n=1 Tax=Dentipellis fragilis TaxID=205917 RepID=A0A4Y9ZGE6_9AGAM|nr:hypothetical protein EVG20_g114 [Dentipellis fragilis]
MPPHSEIDDIFAAKHSDPAPPPPLPKKKSKKRKRDAAAAAVAPAAAPPPAAPDALCTVARHLDRSSSDQEAETREADFQENEASQGRRRRRGAI